MKNQYLSNFISKYKPTKETIDLVNDVLKQNDSRYSEPGSMQVMVAGFIANNAISIKSEKLIKPKESKIPEHKGPQKDLKRIASYLLRNMGFVIDDYEVRINGSVADIVASNKEKCIIVECGPCRIDKPIDYLEINNTTLWVLKRLNEITFVLYEFTRGKRWNEFAKMKQKEFDDVQSSYDRIMDDI